MNSKEALEKLNIKCIRSNGIDDEYFEEFNIIKRDLEVLEILKKFILISKSCDDDLFPYDIDVKQQYVSSRSCLVLTEEEYYKIKRWLDNEE